MASIPSMLERPERNDPPQGRERGSRFKKITKKFELFACFYFIFCLFLNKESILISNEKQDILIKSEDFLN